MKIKKRFNVLYRALENLIRENEKLIFLCEDEFLKKKLIASNYLSKIVITQLMQNLEDETFISGFRLYYSSALEIHQDIKTNLRS